MKIFIVTMPAGRFCVHSLYLFYRHPSIYYSTDEIGLHFAYFLIEMLSEDPHSNRSMHQI